MLSAEMHRGNREPIREGSYGRFLYNRFRYYDPSIGSYVSADPIGQSKNLNLFQYAAANSLRFIDPFGLDRVLIVVGDRGKGRHNVGSNFERAAETSAAEARARGDEADVVRASTVGDVDSAINSGDPVDRLEYFGHGWDGVLYPGEDPGADTNIDASNIGKLSGGNLNPGASATINACRSGAGGDASIAQQLANQLGVPVSGPTGPMGFSPDPSGPPDSSPGATPPDSGPLYMTPVSGSRMKTFHPKAP
jgi:RHS repeat-associated protein